MRYYSIICTILCFTALTFASANDAAGPGWLWANAAGILFIILLGGEGRLICMNRQLVKLKEVLRESPQESRPLYDRWNRR